MELYARFANAAKAKGLSMSEYLVELMQHASEGTGLTPEQANDIARRMKALYVTGGDVAAAVADEALNIAAYAADKIMRPTANNLIYPAPRARTPIPRIGTRKKRR